MRLTLDYPPFWMGALAGMGWVAAQILTPGPDWLAWPGRALVGLGLAVMGMAAFEMWRARTTLDPHGQPRKLVQSGIYAVSRNPIYLGDALILAGLCLIWGAPLAAITLPFVFSAIITHRFIRHEEASLIALDPDGAAAYLSRTRRWI